MAKLKGPLFSLGASQQLGKALVFFPWKGLNVVREYVIPSNPQTKPQQDQRGYLTAAVAAIHAFQARSSFPFNSVDAMAYALLGSIYATPRTWFNQVVKMWLDNKVDNKTPVIYGDFILTKPAAKQLGVSIFCQGIVVTDGDFWYGTSKTALLYSKNAALAANKATATLTLLTSGVKYYIQFRATAPPAADESRSGIYYGVPN